MDWSALSSQFRRDWRDISMAGADKPEVRQGCSDLLREKRTWWRHGLISLFSHKLVNVVMKQHVYHMCRILPLLHSNYWYCPGQLFFLLVFFHLCSIYDTTIGRPFFTTTRQQTIVAITPQHRIRLTIININKITPPFWQGSSMINSNFTNFCPLLAFDS